LKFEHDDVESGEKATIDDVCKKPLTTYAYESHPPKIQMGCIVNTIEKYYTSEKIIPGGF